MDTSSCDCPPADAVVAAGEEELEGWDVSLWLREVACLLAQSRGTGEGAALALKHPPSSMFPPSALQKGWLDFFLHEVLGACRFTTAVGLGGTIVFTDQVFLLHHIEISLLGVHEGDWSSVQIQRLKLYLCKKLC